MTQHYKTQQSGFTIVELMLSMAFISMMLVAIALCTLQVITTYNRGMTLRQVNVSGRELSQNFARTIADAEPFDVDPDPANLESGFKPEDDGGSPAKQQKGRLCTGKVSYIWNTGEMLSPTATVADRNRYHMVGHPTNPDNDTLLRLVRINDSGGEYCSDPHKLVDPDESEELLSAGDRPLALHRLTITSDPAFLKNETTGQQLYTITFVLGTSDVGAIDFDPAGDTMCRPPADVASNQEYCAVNVFTVTIRSGL